LQLYECIESAKIKVKKKMRNWEVFFRGENSAH